MPDIERICEALEAHGVESVGEIVADVEGLRRYFVSVSVNRDRDNRQVPSNRKLAEIKEVLLQAGISVTFLLRDAVAQDLETGLRATLLHSHIDHIRNVFLSIDKRSVHVWVEPKRELSESHYSDMAKRSAEFLALSDLELGALSSMSDASLPSQLACMDAIRLLAPATLPVIRDFLTMSGFTVPSEHWLTRRLDTIRRANKVVRLGSGSYALSAHGLQVLGTAKRRSSPDITRMLALAKRRG